jgi:hypothetical protein
MMFALALELGWGYQEMMEMSYGELTKFYQMLEEYLDAKHRAEQRAASAARAKRGRRRR